MSNSYVLDSFAVLAYVQAEPSGHRVEALLREAAAGRADLAMSVVNVGEVFYMVQRRKGPQAADEVMAALSRLPVRMVAIALPEAIAAARLKAAHRISYADGFAAALAQSLGAQVVTGDPEFRALEGQVSVLWLGEGSAGG